MKNYEEFLNSNETANQFDQRLQVFRDEYLLYKSKHKDPIKILDIGCGKNVELSNYKIKGDIYYGCDFFSKIKKNINNYKKIDLNKEKLTDKFKNIKFDVIFCGEVIEHLYSPDDLIDEIKELMHNDSILILSTPNFSYWVNRLLMVFGISPLFLENSSSLKLGRKFRFLGQYNQPEGHIRLFTYGALMDLFRIKKLRVIKAKSTLVWNFWPDKFIIRISKNLAPCNVFVLKRDKS